MNCEMNIKFSDEDMTLVVQIAEEVNAGKAIDSFDLSSEERVMVENAVIVIRMNNDGDNMESYLGGTREIIDNIFPHLNKNTDDALAINA